MRSEEELREMSYEKVKEIFLTLKRFDRLFNDMAGILKYYCNLEIVEESYTVVKKCRVKWPVRKEVNPPVHPLI